jgi:hypothetical protein
MRRWKYHIKIELQEAGLAGNTWVDLAQERNRRWAFVDVVMNLQVPSGSVIRLVHIIFEKEISFPYIII